MGGRPLSRQPLGPEGDRARFALASGHSRVSAWRGREFASNRFRRGLRRPRAAWADATETICAYIRAAGSQFLSSAQAVGSELCSEPAAAHWAARW
eukprot:641330-Prymnesium_polylepis.1